mgnify:CR=1 FL=1
MNKKIITLLIATATLCCGCFDSSNILGKYTTWGGPLSLSSKAFEKYDLTYDMTKINGLLDNYIAAIKAEDLSKVKSYRALVNYEACLLDDKCMFANIKWYAHPNDQTKAIYDDLNSKFNSYYVRYVEACEEANKTGNKQIIDTVVGSKAKLPKDAAKEVELSNKMLEFNEKGEALDNDRASYTQEAFFKKGLEMFVEYAEICDEYAELFDYNDEYSNYLDYSYKEVYNRKYSPVDCSNLTTLVKNVVAPKYQQFDISSLNPFVQERIYSARSTSFAAKSLDLGKKLDEYAECLGGSYQDIYTKCFTSGYFIFSNDEKSMSTAVTADLNFNSNGGILYFSKNYQDYSTILHEFGHYYSFRMNDLTMSKSYDLNETFSQGNEMLFSAYLLNNYTGDFYQGIAKQTVDSFYKSLMTICYTVDIENYLFNNYKTKSIDEMYQYIISLYNEYNVPAIYADYWVYPILVSTGYYISYATSIIESLQIFTLARENFSNAYKAYSDLISQQEILGEVEAWEKAGLSSPFKESTITEIVKYYA